MSTPDCCRTNESIVKSKTVLLLSIILAALALLPPAAWAQAQISERNRAPYVSTSEFERTLNLGSAPVIKYYVTDFEHKDYASEDTSEQFTLSVWINDTLHTTQTVNAGENQITLPAMTSVTDDAGFSLQVEDSEGRKSHRLHQRFRVIDPVAHVITPAQTYSPTALELQDDYDIYNDETNAETTTAGLTALLKWASDNGYRKVVLPVGTYLIDENQTVKMATRLTLDMNGSTFKLRPSAKGSSLMLEIAHCYDSHVINGTFEGDLVDHDYSVDSYSEFVNAVRLAQGAEYCSFKDLTIVDVVGYGSNTASDFIGRVPPYNISHNNQKVLGAFALGEIDEATGTWVAATDRTTHATALNIADFVASHGFIQLGKYLGYQSNPTDNWIYRASFYDNGGTYIGSQEGYFYRRMYPPANAHTVRFTLYSAVAPGASVLQVFNIRAPYNCDMINLHHENIRCVGMVPSGFNNLRVEGNTFENCGWFAAKAAFDSEDGWDLSQDLVFVNNTFGNNPHSEFLALSGHNFIIEDNVMAYSHAARVGSIVVRNNVFKSATLGFGPFSRSAYPRFYNNVIEGRVTMSTSYSAAEFDKSYLIRNNILEGGLLVTAPTKEQNLKMYAYQCEIVGSSINGRAVDCEIDGVTSNNALNTKWFQLEDCMVTDSTFATSLVGNESVIVGSTLINCHLSTQHASLTLVDNTLIDTDCLATHWTHAQQWFFQGNTITTSLPYLIQAYNDFTRISLHNNTINYTHPSFKAVLLTSPNSQNASLPTEMSVMVTGNTFNGTAGTAVSVTNLPKPNITLTLGFANNTYNGATEHSSNITGLSNVVFVTPPTTSIVNPLSGTILPAPGTISLVATASDSDGTVAKVEFFDRHIKVGEATSSPYSLTLADLPAKAYSFTARATDNDGAVYVSTVIPVSVNKVVPPKTILFIASSATLSGFDAPLKTRMEAEGHTVIVKDDNYVVAADADGMDLIVISDTVNPALVGTKFRDTAVPVLLWESVLFPELGMTGPTQYVDYGVNGGILNMSMTGSSHPISAGLTGTVALTTATYGQSWAKPSSSATVIATRPTDATKATIFAYESGATMVGMTAPARRVGFPLCHGATLSADGLALFDAAVAWALGL